MVHIIPDDTAIEVFAGREEHASFGGFCQTIGKPDVLFALGPTRTRKMFSVIPSRAHAIPSRIVACSVRGSGG